jgi:uncharacterized protein YlaI
MITFDQSKIKDDSGKQSLTYESEAVRLSNELRSKKARTYIHDQTGKRIDIPAKKGFDIETADFMTMVNWLANPRIKKSNSLIAFVHRCLAVRFPDEYAQNKKKIDSRYKIEKELILSHAKNDVAWIGEVGFSNMIRLDGSLNNSSIKTTKLKNGEIRIIKK